MRLGLLELSDAMVDKLNAVTIQERTTCFVRLDEHDQEDLVSEVTLAIIARNERKHKLSLDAAIRSGVRKWKRFRDTISIPQNIGRRLGACVSIDHPSDQMEVGEN